MTKWKRLRKLREKKRIEVEVLRPKAEVEKVKQTEPEKISKNFQQSQEIEKLDNTKNSKLTTILAQIPRYAYLLTIFALLSGVFFPLITPGIPFDDVIATAKSAGPPPGAEGGMPPGMGGMGGMGGMPPGMGGMM